MRKSVKLYMVQDLILLTVLGVILEGLTERFASTILSGAPTMAFTLLITFVAVVRWNLWGLVVVPFMALATWVGGMLGEIKYLSACYDWRVFISETIALLTIGLNVIFFKKFKTKTIVSNIWFMILMILVDYILYCGVQFVLYRLLSSGSLTHMGTLGDYYDVVQAVYDSAGNPILDANDNYVTETVNVFKSYCFYIEQGFIYNLFGLVVAYVGAFILRSQGALNNAVDKLIDDKRLADAEAEYLKSLGNANSGKAEAEANSEEPKATDVSKAEETKGSDENMF